MDKLVRDICIRFSPDTPEYQVTGQVARVRHAANSDCATVCKADMVLNTARSSTRKCGETESQQGYADNTPGTSVSPRTSDAEPRGLAPEYLEFGHLQLPRRTMEILREAKRPSSRRCYSAKWIRYLHWCKGIRKVSQKTEVKTVRLYLTHLVDNGLTFSSLKVHLAAIVAYTRGVRGDSLFTIPVVKRFLEGTKNVAPHRMWSPPMWNLNVVLTQLM